MQDLRHNTDVKAKGQDNSQNHQIIIIINTDNFTNSILFYVLILRISVYQMKTYII